MFHSYERLGQDDSAIEGAGLGLMIVKQLVEMMQGEMGFSSKQFEGSVFWVKLPLKMAWLFFYQYPGFKINLLFSPVLFVFHHRAHVITRNTFFTQPLNFFLL